MHMKYWPCAQFTPKITFRFMCVADSREKHISVGRAIASLLTRNTCGIHWNVCNCLLHIFSLSRESRSARSLIYALRFFHLCRYSMATIWMCVNVNVFNRSTYVYAEITFARIQYSASNWFEECASARLETENTTTTTTPFFSTLFAVMNVYLFCQVQPTRNWWPAIRIRTLRVAVASRQFIDE